MAQRGGLCESAPARRAFGFSAGLGGQAAFLNGAPFGQSRNRRLATRKRQAPRIFYVTSIQEVKRKRAPEDAFAKINLSKVAHDVFDSPCRMVRAVPLTTATSNV